MEFNLVQKTTRAPFNKCYLCGTFEGPFIDTFVDQFGHGAVFLCCPRIDPTTGEEEKPGCVGMMAKLAGYFSTQEMQAAQAHIAELKVRIAELESLERQVVIPEAQFKEYVESLTPRIEFITEEDE